jgi:hypothetical protein
MLTLQQAFLVPSATLAPLENPSNLIQSDMGQSENILDALSSEGNVAQILLITKLSQPSTI